MSESIGASRLMTLWDMAKRDDDWSVLSPAELKVAMKYRDTILKRERKLILRHPPASSGVRSGSGRSGGAGGNSDMVRHEESAAGADVMGVWTASEAAG